MRTTLAHLWISFALALAIWTAGGVHVAAADPQALSSPTPVPASASPTPQPSPTGTSLMLGPLSVDGVFSGFTMSTNNVNATGALDTPNGVDLPSRTDVSNALLIVNKNSGTLRYGFTAGAYNIPVVGVSLNKTIQNGANTALYGALPAIDLEYAPTANWNLMAGKLATFTGQEDTFTYEDQNIQRGLIWNLETAVSRGVRANFAGSKFSGAIELNDGYYSGSYVGVEGQVTDAASASTSYEFVWVIPNASAPANPTASVANKRLYNPLVTCSTGKWTFWPYLLFVDSPASKALGYTVDEHAFGAVLGVTDALSQTWSLPLRIEYGLNGSAPGDTSPNANLLGYGPGSRAWTYTLTPTYRRGIFFARAEGSLVDVYGFTPGLAFGGAGQLGEQFRAGAEAGIQF